MLPDKILEHPIMKHLFDEDFIYLVSFIWVLMLLFTILYWLFTFKIEKAEKEILEKVTIEAVQNELFTNYIKYYIKDEKTFSKKDFMNYLLWEITYEIRNKKLRKIVNDSISMKILQNIADIILKRAEEQKIVQKVENHSLIEQFELTKE